MLNKNLLLAATLALAAMPTLHAQTVPPGTVVNSVTHTNETSGAPTVAEVSDFTAVADVAGSLGGLAFRFYNPNAVCYEPWIDVDDGDTAPTATTGCTLVEVDINADDTADDVAAAIRTKLNASPYTTYFTVTGATTHVILTSVLKGSATDGNVGTSTFSVSKTQGVSGTKAIASASIVKNLLGWRICNDAVQTSTWLAVGKTALDPDVDGTRLGKGKCFECPSCTKASLDALYVSAQAASAGYAVVQFKGD